MSQTLLEDGIAKLEKLMHEIEIKSQALEKLNSHKLSLVIELLSSVQKQLNEIKLNLYSFKTLMYYTSPNDAIQDKLDAMDNKLEVLIQRTMEK